MLRANLATACRGASVAKATPSSTTATPQCPSVAAPTPARRLHPAQLRERDHGDQKSGTWSLRILGRTLRYDLWLSDASADVSASIGSHLDPDGYVGSRRPPARRSASARSAVALTGCAPAGQVNYDRETNRVAPFSSAGPVRDGRFAPTSWPWRVHCLDAVDRCLSRHGALGLHHH